MFFKFPGGLPLGDRPARRAESGGFLLRVIFSVIFGFHPLSSAWLRLLFQAPT